MESLKPHLIFLCNFCGVGTALVAVRFKIRQILEFFLDIAIWAYIIEMILKPMNAEFGFYTHFLNRGDEAMKRAVDSL
jgi:hypothetical protein